MDVTYEQDVCFFVGGIGAKTGVPRAGGCTKAWLAAKNGDPSGLFGADSACVYSNPSIQIGMDSTDQEGHTHIDDYRFGNCKNQYPRGAISQR